MSSPTHGKPSASECARALYAFSTSHSRRHADFLYLQGGAFAWQEAQIALVTIFQHFDLVMNDPTYELHMKQTLSIKPKDFFIRAIPRKNSPHQFVPKSINVSKKA